MNPNDCLNAIRQDIDDGNRVIVGYLSMLFEQGQKQRPLTEDEQRAAFNRGIDDLVAEELRKEQTGL